MNATISEQEMLPLEDPNPCQIVVLSEDMMTHELAMEVCGTMLSRFSDEMAFAFNFWKFNDLKDLKSARRAAGTIARADVVVLSLRRAALDPEALRWLETEIAPRTKLEGALALMIAEGSGGSPAFKTLLSQMELLAARWGVDFLPQLSALPALAVGQPANVPPELLHPVPTDAGYEHWGLNE